VNARGASPRIRTRFEESVRWRHVIFGFSLLLLSFSVGSSWHKWEMKEAERLQGKGMSAAALDLFQSLLSHAPTISQGEQSKLWSHIGECYYALQEPGEAFNAYHRALQLDANNHFARLRLGELYLLGGSIEKASEEARNVLASGPSAEAFELLGTAAAADEDAPVAMDSFRRALELDPTRIKAAVWLAQLLDQANRGDEAEEVLKRAAQAQPRSAAPYLALGRLAEEYGRNEDAEAAYRKAAETEDTVETKLQLAQFLERSARLEEAQKILADVDVSQPESPPVLGDFELLAGKPLLAGRNYAGHLQDGPSQGWKGRQGQSERYRAQLISRLIEADIQALQRSDPSEAALRMTLAREHLAKFGSELDPATRCVLSVELELIDGDLTVAASEARKAVEMAPESPSAHYAVGLLYERMGNNAGAVTEWQTALQARSDFAPASLALAEMMLRSGNVGLAEQQVVPVLRQEPANLQALIIFCRVLQRRGAYQAARAVSNRVEAIDPASAQASILRGEIALGEHQIASALLNYEQAMILDSSSPEAMQGLMRVYGEGVITRPMLLQMERFAASDKNLSSLMELTGRLFAAHGWTRDAIRCLRRACETDPERGSAAEAMAKLLARHGQMVAAADSATRVREFSTLLAGVKAERKHDLTAAVRNYEAAVHGGDNSGISANNLAWIYARQGRELERALALAKHACELAPEDPAVLDTLGVVHLARREYSNAVAVLELARTLAQSQGQNGAGVLAEIKHHLSEAYLRTGQTEQASLDPATRESSHSGDPGLTGGRSAQRAQLQRAPGTPMRTHTE
jgi:tetratricopeptide (TPR) repeat protein